MKKVAKIAARLLAGALMTALVFSTAGCGKKEEAHAQEEQAVQESADAEIEEVINPEEVKTEEAKEKTCLLADTAEAALFARGALFDRPYTAALSQLVFGADPVAAAAQKKLKDVFDPQGILNPGKLCF